MRKRRTKGMSLSIRFLFALTMKRYNSIVKTKHKKKMEKKRKKDPYVIMMIERGRERER